VLDIGCGKGGALIDFHRCGYHKLGGIELSDKMVRVCRSNLSKAKIEAAIIHADASKFHDFADFELLYIANTLPTEGLAKLLANLKEFVLEAKSSRLILFINPLWDYSQLLSKTPGVAKVAEFQRGSYYALYRAEAATVFAS
jgi:SAM-dependent methyltransferase